VQGQLDTTYTFPAVPAGRYTVVVWGEKATDTLGYSIDSVESGNHIFDPRLLSNPDSVQATSAGESSIKIRWKRIPEESYAGFAGYALFYKDTNNIDGKTDSGKVNYYSSITTDSSDQTWAVASVGVTNNDPAKVQFNREHPYRFWVMSLRSDSVFFRNFAGADSTTVTWAGAAQLNLFNSGGTVTIGDTTHDTTHNAVDSFAGGTQAFQTSLTIEPGLNGTWVLADSLDPSYPSNPDLAQILIANNAGQVTLSTNKNNKPNTGATFMNRIDDAHSLDQQYYTQPLGNPSDFTQNSITLPATNSKGGVIVYEMIPDNGIDLGNGKPMFARLFIAWQPLTNSFLDLHNKLHISVSFQPGTDNGGQVHLPYY
jgi:hypothetical protein